MRKNWKKALTLVMAAAMAAGLAGCGNGAKQAEETTAAQTEAANRGCKNGGGDHGGTGGGGRPDGEHHRSHRDFLQLVGRRFKARSHSGRSRCVYEEVSEYYGKDFIFRMGWLGR